MSVRFSQPMPAVRLHDVAKTLKATAFIKPQNPDLHPTAEEALSLQSPDECFYSMP